MESNQHPQTIKQIAKLVGVSPTTISFYLNGKLNKMSRATANKILQTIEKYHYQPAFYAQQLRTGKSWRIALVVGNLTQEFTITLWRSLQANLSDKRFQIELYATNLNQAKEALIINRLINQKVHAIIFQPSLAGEKLIAKWQAKILQSGIQLILIDPQNLNLNVTSYVRDYTKALNELSEKFKNQVTKVIFVSENINLMATRQKRYHQIQEIAAKQKWNFEFWLLKEKDQIIRLKQLFNFKQEWSKVLFINNNPEIARNLLIALKQLNLMTEQLKIASFNQCKWQTIIDNQIIEIISHNKMIGQAIAKQISNQQKGTYFLGANLKEKEIYESKNNQYLK